MPYKTSSGLICTWLLSKESWGGPTADCWLHFMLDCKARNGSLVGYSSYTKRDGGGERACQAGRPRDQTDPSGCSPLESPHPKVSPCVQSIAIWSVEVDAFSARLRQATSFGAWMQDCKCSYTRLATLTWYTANQTRSNRS